MKTKIRFSIGTGGKLQALYSDKALPVLNKLKVGLLRASHIDPLSRPTLRSWLNPRNWKSNISRLSYLRQHGSRAWVITWKNELSAWPDTYCDEIGQPFLSKAAAERFEVAKIERDHFRRNYVGQQLLNANLN
jgi:hypothetical protein